MFVVMVNYKKPLEEIDAMLSAHGQFLDKYYAAKRFIVSGRRNPRTGGIIMAHAASKEEMQRILQEDPFYLHGLAEYEIVEFTPTKWGTELAAIAPDGV